MSGRSGYVGWAQGGQWHVRAPSPGTVPAAAQNQAAQNLPRHRTKRSRSCVTKREME